MLSLLEVNSGSRALRPVILFYQHILGRKGHKYYWSTLERLLKLYVFRVDSLSFALMQLPAYCHLLARKYLPSEQLQFGCNQWSLLVVFIHYTDIILVLPVVLVSLHVRTVRIGPVQFQELGFQLENSKGQKRTSANQKKSTYFISQSNTPASDTARFVEYGVEIDPDVLVFL